MDVIVEIGPKRCTFARAVDWPGWCRAGRDEAAALAAIDACRQRYLEAVARVHVPPPRGAPDVVERVSGSAVTDFGAMATAARRDCDAFTDHELDRQIALLAATWDAFDDAYKAIPDGARRRKPQRGRSAQEMLDHVVETDLMHLSGITPGAFRKPRPGCSLDDLRAVRRSITDALKSVRVGVGYEPARRYGFSWTPRFSLQRSAWHAIDHAWELADHEQASSHRQSRGSA